MLKTAPAVFAVGNEYQIMVPVTAPSLFWVEVDGKCYYDAENGIMRSLCTTHRVSVPMEALDNAGTYTVYERVIIDRSPYFPKTEEPVGKTFSFRPVPKDNIRLFHISDTHNSFELPVTSAKMCENIDVLVMNGDILDHSGDIEKFDIIYQIAEAITGGEIPIIFARGNHDLRGYYAEQIANHTPNHNGKTYFTFRLGSIWGVALDCGEDKWDSCEEYGHTVACHDFRLKETEFIKEIIANADKEYNAPGVEHRLVVCHAPFSWVHKHPFDIETEIYTRWCKLLKEHVKPDLMLSGHLHRIVNSPLGGEMDHLGQPCHVLVAAAVRKKVDPPYYIGTSINLAKDKPIVVKTYDTRGEVGEFEVER